MPFVHISRKALLKVSRHVHLLNINSSVTKRRFSTRLSQLYSQTTCFSKPVGVTFGGIAIGLSVGVACAQHEKGRSIFAEAVARSINDHALNTTKGSGGSNVPSDQIDGFAKDADGKGSQQPLEAVEAEVDGIADGHGETGRKDIPGTEERFDWPQLIEIVSPYWKRLLFAVGSAFVVAAINIEIPSVLGKLVDAVTSHLMSLGSSMSQEATTAFLEKLKEPASRLVLLYLAQALGTFSYIYNLSVIGEGMAMELRTRLYASLLSQEITFFDTHMTGEVVSRLTADIQEFKSGFKHCVSQGLRSVSQTLGCVVSLYFVSKEMTVTVIAVVPAIILLGTFFTRGLRKLSRKAQTQFSESSGHAEETLSNIRTVKAFAMEEQELLKFQNKTELLRQFNIQLGAGIGLFQAGSNLFLNGIVLGVMYTGGKLIAAQKLSSGDLMSFLVASQTIQRSLANMSLIFGQYVRGIGAGTRVFHYVNLNPNTSNVRKETGLIPSHLEGDIEFHNVTFSYPTRPQKIVLKEFSLKLPKGKMVAVVGASGSGKSTLANIMEGFYPLQKGSVTIDGNAVEELNTKWLRGEAIGIINQEPILFATSIMENIRYGKPSASDEEVIEAAKRANAYEFIMDFPEGFNTKLGERGVTVSGGQKQRVAIARALIKQPKILILDEATSALDADSERVVQSALDSAVQGRTVLVIAHRLSTVKNADVIAVMSHGAIVEIGTHDNLMHRKGFYYNLVKQQEFFTSAQ